MSRDLLHRIRSLSLWLHIMLYSAVFVFLNFVLYTNHTYSVMICESNGKQIVGA